MDDSLIDSIFFVTFMALTFCWIKIVGPKLFAFTKIRLID